MQDFSILARVETALFLLIIAGLSAIGLKKLKIPYTIGLVPIGIVVAMLAQYFPQTEPYQNLQLNQELIMYILLPALIFDASINIDAKLLWKNIVPTIVLAAPGLIIATVLTGLGMKLFTPLSIASCMLFGALISATDPVAVISLFELVGAPKRLRILVDGESLFNDATAIAMFNLVLKMVLAGTVLSWTSIAQGTVDFFFVFFAGLAIGIILGLIASKIIAWANNDTHIEIAITILLAYGSFLIADRIFHASGVMASLGAGVVTSYFGRTKQTDSGRKSLQSFWAFVSFLANSAIFLLLGFTEENLLFTLPSSGVWKMILVAVISIQVARLVVVFGICPFIGKGKQKISLSYMTVMFWGGLRGAVPLALVFSLPADLPERQEIMQITLAVVLFTLLIQGLTTSKLLSFFKLGTPTRLVQLADKIAMLCARKNSLEQLKKLSSIKSVTGNELKEMKREYKDKISALELDILKQVKECPKDRDACARMVWATAGNAELKSWEDSYETGLISEDIYRKLLGLKKHQTDDDDDFSNPENYFNPEYFKRKVRRPRLSLIDNCIFKVLFPKTSYNILLEEYSGILALLLGSVVAEKAAEGQFMEDIDISNEIKKCKDFYKDRRRVLELALDEFKTFGETKMSNIRKQTLRQVVYSIERSKINELAESGAILENEAEVLLERILMHSNANKMQSKS